LRLRNDKGHTQQHDQNRERTQSHLHKKTSTLNLGLNG
jgi:hypothetical protein